jgi:hypothetical protein
MVWGGGGEGVAFEKHVICCQLTILRWLNPYLCCAYCICILSHLTVLTYWYQPHDRLKWNIKIKYQY